MICENLQQCNQDKGFICARKKDCILCWDNRKNVACEERGKRYNLINSQRKDITLYHVDGGIVYNDNNVKKCDYLYIVHDSQCATAIMVELKGKDILGAIEQIEQSVERFGPILKSRVFARIICGSVPRLFNDPSVRRLKKKLINEYKGNLKLSVKNMDEEYALL